MTRVNTVPVESLHRLHLIGEIKEITRVFGFARAATQKYGNAYQWRLHKKPPAQYVLGTGHVMFFVDKLGYISERYKLLCAEWRSRGYNINQISEEDLLAGIHPSFIGMYIPTNEAIVLNTARINERLKLMGGINEHSWLYTERTLWRMSRGL